MRQEIDVISDTEALKTIIITDYDLMGPLILAGLDKKSHVYGGFERDRYAWQGEIPEGDALIILKAHQELPHKHCFGAIQTLKNLNRNPKIRKSTLTVLRGRLRPNCLAKRSL